MKKAVIALLSTVAVLGACGNYSSNEGPLPYEDENGSEENAVANGEGNGNNEENVTDAGNGEELYLSSCASCHGDNLEGDFGPGLLDASFDLNMDYLVNDPNDMHEGLVNEEEAEMIAEWITSQGNGNGDNEAASDDNGENRLTDADGEEVYIQSCASCHGDNLEGDFGPGLAGEDFDVSMNILLENPDDFHEGLVIEDEATAVSEWMAEQ
ncbi:c-type cytochrome [Salisediminibacterium beveridgei]|uniref:Cytochrome c domain-containing protein n=1 Tax=Salisediminibacterium beveridgei TaxID=632773 RepID=A0A1D7QXR9_9BACI|nr:c-type cytochrome [Salisediminibacterium beveridgei]AOM83800.1 hypothetical protein BBEV_2460 [Salisediminibacterium beveridgei]